MEELSNIRGIVCGKGEADSFSWGFESKGSELKRLDFKLPSVGEDEIRIKVTNVGLCYSDVMCAEDLWKCMKAWPLVPGHEICGIVEKMGNSVRGFKVGG